MPIVASKTNTDVANFVQKMYTAYFKVTFEDQDKNWAPHKDISETVH